MLWRYSSLTSSAHVTSSVKWSFDSPWALSYYRLPIGNNPLISGSLKIRTCIHNRNTDIHIDWQKGILKACSSIRVSKYSQLTASARRTDSICRDAISTFQHPRRQTVGGDIGNAFINDLITWQYLTLNLVDLSGTLTQISRPSFWVQRHQTAPLRPAPCHSPVVLILIIIALRVHGICSSRPAI